MQNFHQCQRPLARCHTGLWDSSLPPSCDFFQCLAMYFCLVSVCLRSAQATQMTLCPCCHTCMSETLCAQGDFWKTFGSCISLRCTDPQWHFVQWCSQERRSLCVFQSDFSIPPHICKFLELIPDSSPAATVTAVFYWVKCRMRGCSCLI